MAAGDRSDLPVDGTVVELSDCIDANEGIAPDRLPRKSTPDLREGDVILLRLSGGGDYVADLADALMRREQKSALRASALSWKGPLHEAMRARGEGFVAMRMRERGIRVPSPQYLWNWASNIVMAPQSESTFRGLIHSLVDPGVLDATDGAEAYASMRWGEITELKSYHHRAGMEIRSELLQQVNALILRREKIGDVHTIELQGIASGQMALLRVSAVEIGRAHV